MTWLTLAVILLHLTMESAEIYNSAHPAISYSIWSLMKLPYTVALGSVSEGRPDISPNFHHDDDDDIRMTTMSYLGGPWPSSSAPSVDRVQSVSLLESRRKRSSTLRSQRVNSVTIRISMPSSFGFRSWRWYETTIETVAVGIYLYATFVLTSTLFLNADQAIIFSTIMAICLSFVRIFTVLF